MNSSDRIIRDPAVLGGVATVRDTGISVSQILRALAANCTETEILAAHPTLEPADIRAALHYTALTLRS